MRTTGGSTNGRATTPAPTTPNSGSAEILSYISTFMTLEPLDVVLTGTPEGVGALRPGDRLEVAVEGVGTLFTLIGPKEERPW